MENINKFLEILELNKGQWNIEDKVLFNRIKSDLELVQKAGKRHN